MTWKSFAVAIACLITPFALLQGAKAQDNDSDIETDLELPHRPIVRLIYFLPRDREPEPDIDKKIDRLIKDVQQLYADLMEAHGFGRKTFLFETDARGKAVVHRFVGKFTDSHYSNLSDTWEVWEEIDQQFDASKNTYLTLIDTSRIVLNLGPNLRGSHNTASGLGAAVGSGGKVLLAGFLAARGSDAGSETTAHELGHAFGLMHDYRSNAKRIRLSGDSILSLDPTINSFCAAEWLDGHRAFNPGRTSFNQNTTIKMFPPSLASPSDAIRFRFEITDPDGIHQVQLLKIESGRGTDPSLFDCKGLNGNPNSTVEFVIRSIPKDKWVNLHVMDEYGNVKREQFPIEITPLLPPAGSVSIPDTNLAAAVREEIGQSITTQTMLNLTHLVVFNRQITDLTGLEHAHNLKVLVLDGEYVDGEGYVNSNAVSNFSPLEGLTQLTELRLTFGSISDVSMLSGLTQLRNLDLSNNSISDVTPLSGLTQLEILGLSNNSISDISVLSDLTRLERLYLDNNTISDVSALSSLTQLINLWIANNSISDVSALSGLTRLIVLYLNNNTISDVSALSGLTQLEHLDLSNNSISDVTPLSGLTQLGILGLSNNSISDSDVSALSGLTQLTSLHLGDNAISDVTPLAGLTQLIELDLRHNTISDVSPLETLNLRGTDTELDIEGGNIWYSAGLRLEGNPLSHASINTHIPAMQAKGIEVQFDIPPALLKGGPKIEGPWLWVLLSGAQFENFLSTDLLAQTSGDKVTELNIATDGAVEGESVGDSVWTSHKISSTGGNNINDLLNALSISKGNVNENVVYGSIILDSPHEQKTKMFAGSDDNHKVWLNGKLVNEQLNWNWATDYQEFFPVTLKRGKNVLLVAVHDGGGGWCGFFGFAPDTEYTVRAPGTGDTYSEFPDVNSDGVVNIQDLVLVASRFGQTGQNKADVNGDNVVNIVDLVLVAGALGKSAAAPALHLQVSEVLTSADVRRWLSQAQNLNLSDVRAQRGISFLQQLLAALLPKETALLANYPNPFNPETWIPYQLAEPAAITVKIYEMNGHVVRTLVLGYQPAGIYKSRRRAAYWDGKNQQGEVVASGVYFYTLSAGDFSATRKMLIRK